MITLFEDINDNEKSTVRDKNTSTKPANNKRRITWHRRIASRIARVLSLEKSVNSEEEESDAHADLGIEKAIAPAANTQQPYALAEMNG